MPVTHFGEYLLTQIELFVFLIYSAVITGFDISGPMTIFDTASYGFGLNFVEGLQLYCDKLGNLGSNILLKSTAPLDANGWNHVALRYEQSESRISFCVNGKPHITQISTHIASSMFFIGDGKLRYK